MAMLKALCPGCAAPYSPGDASAEGRWGDNPCLEMDPRSGQRETSLWDVQKATCYLQIGWASVSERFKRFQMGDFVKHAPMDNFIMWFKKCSFENDAFFQILLSEAPVASSWQPSTVQCFHAFRPAWLETNSWRKGSLAAAYIAFWCTPYSPGPPKVRETKHWASIICVTSSFYYLKRFDKFDKCQRVDLAASPCFALFLQRSF